MPIHLHNGNSLHNDQKYKVIIEVRFACNLVGTERVLFLLKKNCVGHIVSHPGVLPLPGRQRVGIIYSIGVERIDRFSSESLCMGACVPAIT
jgi:hypothetical protein